RCRDALRIATSVGSVDPGSRPVSGLAGGRGRGLRSGGRAFPCGTCDIGRLAQWRFATALTRLPLRGQRRNGQKASPASRFNPSADADGSPGTPLIVRHAGRRVVEGGDTDVTVPPQYLALTNPAPAICCVRRFRRLLPAG